jgi:sugar phosphate isomerase/epimerase
MTAPIGVQLYTVREALAQDFQGVIRKIADIGYAGVEPILNLPGTTLDEAVQLFQELGLQVPSGHAPLPLGDNKQKVLDYAAAFGCKWLFPSTDRRRFGTIDQVKEICEQFNEGQAVAATAGITLGVHNHWWEFERVEGRYAYEVMLEHLDPAILFQIDTYWVQAAGLDPVQVVKSFGTRAPSLHIKDGPAVQDEPMVAVGDGVMDFHRVIQAAEGSVDWLIVELDECATDMMTAVEKSFEYLTREGLGHGKQG